MTRLIKVENLENVREINEIATRFQFDVWVHGRSMEADAKSLMNLLALDWKNDELRIVTEDNINPKYLYKAMKKYLID